MTEPSDELLREVERAIYSGNDPDLALIAFTHGRRAYPIIRKAVLAEVAGWLRERSDENRWKGAIYAAVECADIADRIEKGDLT